VRIAAYVKPLVAHVVRIPKDESLPLQYWIVDGLPKLNGKRQRKFFHTKEAAERELFKVKHKLRREGEKALLLSDAQRIEAFDSIELLKPYNASLRDAANFFIAHHEAAKKSCTVEAAVGEYLKVQKQNRRSERHLEDLKYRLGTFAKAFRTRLISSFTVHEIEKWLHGLGQAPKSTNNFHGAVSALFSFAIKRGYAASNPFTAIDKVRVAAKPPGILTPEECQRLLDAADYEIRPLIAVQAFCGVRSAETLRLSWSDIDIARGLINIAAEHSKGARRRLVEMPENFKEWLLPYVRNRSGKLWIRDSMQYHIQLKASRIAAGIAAWPSNALRHSYASYHLGFHQNAAALALQMGHTSQAIIFSNYRELVTPDEAKRYWNVRPKATAENVIPIEVSVL
jgi:integrase/recombinase XerD